MMFALGTYPGGMDNDGRLILPERYGEELKPGVVLTKGQERCLYVFPRTRFVEITEPLRSAPFTDKKRRQFSRVLFASAADLIPDEHGGITIPKGLREYAFLKSKCIVIGVNDRLEIWAAEAWNAYRAAQEDGFSAWPGETPPEFEDGQSEE